MKIKELNLIGFGKFTNKRISLRNGINIIYGDNEAGKSTLHSFIDGMFYGFLKPYATRTIYLDSYEKYRPWSGRRYAGTIKFHYQGSDYTIERDFTKGNENTSVFIDSTGENIINDIDTGNKGRIQQPGYHFFGFSDAVFSNTISIKQLASRTDESLANELRDRLANTSSSLDENLSVEMAIEELNKSLRDIGTSRAPTSLYGRTLIDIEDLSVERNRILDYKKEYNEILRKSTDLDTRLKEAERDIRLLRSNYQDALIIEKNNIYKRCLLIIKEIDKLKKEETVYEKYKNISMDSYTEGLRLSDGLENLEKRQGLLKDDLLEVETTLKGFESSKLSLQEDSRIESDFLEFEELEEEKNKALILNNNRGSEFLKRDCEREAGRAKVFKIIFFIGLILALGLASYGLRNSSLALLISLFAFLLSAFSIIKAKKASSIRKNLKDKYMNLERSSNELRERIQKIEERQKAILESYKINSNLEFKKIYRDKQVDIFRAKDRKNALSENLRKREGLKKELGIIEDKIRKSNLGLSKILEKNISANIEELKEAIDKKETYKFIKEEIRTKKLTLDNNLATYKMEELERDLSDYGKEIDKIKINQSSESLKLKIQDQENYINDLRIESSGIRERLDVLNREVKKLVEIDEEIYRKNNLIESLDKKKSALELSKDTIVNLAKDIHQQFAPEINKKVGGIISLITNGKYESIRLDDKLKLGVINPEDNQIIPLDSLSGGTIDQLYFALRFGVVDSIGDKEPPLILDDCFIQYDESRLTKMMEYLSKLGATRQIILFTCHKRELEALRRMGKGFNLINLS